MKLLRLGMLYFSSPPRGWESFEATIDGVRARTLKVGEALPVEGNLRVLLVTETTLQSLPERDCEGYISVPDRDRRRCEKVLEAVANLLAVISQCGRKISSPNPPAAFVAENEAEQKFLSECRGVRVSRIPRVNPKYPIKLTNEIVSGLLDRNDGLALMAEARSHVQALGKYREFIRLFELAFGLPVNRLEKKLFQYLSGGPSLGYTRPEVAAWLSLRHGASHADLKETKTIVLEADASPIIARIEQAAEDVLFNKLKWHDPSRERRVLLKPLAAIMSDSGDLKIVRGSAGSLHPELFDDFSIYPIDLSPNIAAPPEPWWWKPN